MSDNNKGLKVLICGGGNGAHVFAALSSLHFETNVLDLFQDEATRWTTAMQSNGFCIDKHNPDDSRTSINAKPFKVSKSPEEVVPGCNIVIITVPAFAHDAYFEALKPNVGNGVFIVGVPGGSGFEFAAKYILSDVKYNIINFETLPWACRIKEYGKCVEILGTKDSINGNSKVDFKVSGIDAVGALQTMMGEHPKLIVDEEGHIMSMTFMAVNSYIHPAILYARWKSWDGSPVAEPPLFYQGIDEFGAKILSDMSNEMLQTAKQITKLRPEVKFSVEHVWSWYLKCYAEQMADKSTLCRSLQTNHAYEGLTHPMKKVEGGYVPNLQHRYFTEDIPVGLMVLKGISHIVGVKTPATDEVLMWAQEKMGKEYLVDGQLKGKDMEETRTPQKYGLNTLDDLLL